MPCRGALSRGAEAVTIAPKSWLDRFLVSSDWENRFSGVVQCILPRPVLVHFPILLDGGGIKSGPTPLWFENMLLKAEGFKELLKSWWQNLNFCGSHSYILAAKLKALKGLPKILEQGGVR